MKAIVTGGSGFVGSALIKELVKNDIEVLCIDKVISNSRVQDDPLIKKIEMSIDDIDSLEKKVKKAEYDLFYHFAWLGSAGVARSDINIQTQNALLNVKCLQLAHRIGCKKFIAAGSIMEFEVNETIYSQGSKPSTNYIYGVGKVLAHELCKPVANEIGIDLVWAYITNAYGVGEKSPRFINSTLRKIINNQPLEFTAGTQNYDFIYIDDVAIAFYLLGIKGKANKGYMIGSGAARPLKEFIIEMCDSNRSEVKPLFGNVPFTGVNLPLEAFSIEEIQTDCGFQPTVSFADGTKRTLEWLRSVD